MATEHLEAKPTPRGLRSIKLEAGTLIADKYRLVRPAGFGGMAAIWVARNQATEAEVAVKILLAERATSREAFERFRREAHAAAALSHRAIVRVFDLLELADAPGSLAMVMELLHGRTLQEAMDDKRKFTVAETLDIMMPVLSGLAHAHRRGVVHRDLKPENVFLSIDPDDHVMPKILDFGISKLTATAVPSITTDGALLGTPGYMSPEQARGSLDADARSDVFTIGILVYQMLSGQNPFTSESYHSVVAAILERDPRPLADIPPALWAVLQRALAKKPGERYRDAAELASAIRTAMGDLAGRPSVMSIPDLAILGAPVSEPAPHESGSMPQLPAADASQDGIDAIPVHKTAGRVGKLLLVLAVALAAAALSVVIGRSRPAASVAPAAAASMVTARPSGAASAVASAVSPAAVEAATPSARGAAPIVTPNPAGPSTPSTTKAVRNTATVKPAASHGTSVVRDPGF